MNRKWIVLACALCLMLALPVTANTVTVTIISQGVAADADETNTVAIPTVSGWKVPIAGATWVTDPTTYALPTRSPANGYTAIMTQTFVLPYVHNTGSVTVWADDTADVYLDGVQKYFANLLAPNGTCQMGVIGCLDRFGGAVSLNGLGAGSHVLEVVPHQVGGDGFGALWEGSVRSVPDGGVTVMLLGGVLVGLATLRRKLSA